MHAKTLISWGPYTKVGPLKRIWGFPIPNLHFDKRTIVFPGLTYPTDNVSCRKRQLMAVFISDEPPKCAWMNINIMTFGWKHVYKFVKHVVSLCHIPNVKLSQILHHHTADMLILILMFWRDVKRFILRSLQAIIIVMFLPGVEAKHSMKTEITSMKTTSKNQKKFYLVRFIHTLRCCTFCFTSRGAILHVCF